MPSEKKFEQAIELADNVQILEWHPEFIRMGKLLATEEKYPDEALVHLMATAPGRVPPIVVYPSRSKGEFDIIDGHHRFNAAQEAGLKGMWAVVIDKGSYA